MEIFKWDADFSTGIQAVDSQHQKLVEMINTAVKLCVSDREMDAGEVESLKHSLMDYTAYHFETEIRLMQKNHIDPRHLEEHGLAHRDFVSAVQMFFKDESVYRYRDSLEKVVEFLIQWLAYHILHTDKSMSNQIERICRGESPEEAYVRELQRSEAASGPLLKALKALFFLVSEKNRSLEESNRVLEEKVLQRTEELAASNRKLQELSLTDELTNLPNRRYALDYLEQLVRSWERYGEVFSVMFIDADKFKQVNDLYGHEEGDAVLHWIAGFLRKNLRKSDVVCRFGGDEFVVICPASSREEALNAARHILERVESENRSGTVPHWKASFSMGISQISQTCSTPESVLKEADEAMYRAKTSGGNRVLAGGRTPETAGT